jgi:hypothetical protein
MAMKSTEKQTKEFIIHILMSEYGWKRDFCVEYIMERRYNQMGHQQAIEAVSEKFRLATQTEVDSELSTGGEQK